MIYKIILLNLNKSERYAENGEGMIQYRQIVDLYMCLHKSGKRTQFIIARTNDPHNDLKEACFPNGCVNHEIVRNRINI